MEEQARAVRLIELTLYPYCMNVTSDPVIYYYSHCSILLFYLPPSFRYLTEIQDMNISVDEIQSIGKHITPLNIYLYLHSFLLFLFSLYI